jgi:hypothetical protein
LLPCPLLAHVASCRCLDESPWKLIITIFA